MEEKKDVKQRSSIEEKCNFIFFIFLFVLEALIIGLFALIKYPNTSYGRSDYFQTFQFYSHFISYHQLLIDISIFMLVGFGFLIVFLKFHRWSSLGFTLFAASFSIQIYILFACFWNKALSTNFPNLNYITLGTLVAAEKGSIAIIICMGALIGKVDPFQIVFISLIAMFFYTLNENILFGKLLVRDIGGCFYIHSFASSVGLISSWIYSPKCNCFNNPNSSGSYFTITTTFIGSFFLWSLFPSFNCINPLHSTQFWNSRFLAIMNTFFALVSSTGFTFWISSLLNDGKISVDHIINASLSGGITISGSADMFSKPVGPLVIGGISGIISTLCLKFLAPKLELIKLFDTRGIFSIHFIPSFLGSVISAISCCLLESSSYSLAGEQVRSEFLFGRSANIQGGYQYAGFACSIGMGISAGLILGFVLRIWRMFGIPEDTFGDHIWWSLGQEDSFNSTFKKIVSKSQTFHQVTDLSNRIRINE